MVVMLTKQSVKYLVLLDYLNLKIVKMADFMLCVFYYNFK
jgi:hypothetical protein